MEKDEKISIFWKRATVQLICVLGVIGLYFMMNSFFLQKFDLQTNTYMGMDQMNSTPLGTYIARIGKAYQEFVRPSRSVSADMYPMRSYSLYLAMLCVDLVLGLWQGIQIGKSNKGKAILFFLLLALFPLANDFIYIMSERVHGLMTYSLVMQAALFIFLVDRTEFLSLLKSERTACLLYRMVSGVAVVLLGLMGVVYIRFDNQCYLKATFQQQEAISFFTTLAAQIKATPGFRDDTPVAFLNEQEISDRTLYQMKELDFIHLDPYGEDLQGYVNSYAWRTFMERWCGFSPDWTNPSDYVNLPEVRTMPHYPEDGSIQRIGDAIVVNF